MNLDNMKYFISVVNHASITKAAKELKLTQPALSTAISKMEDELGITLLKRYYHGVIPTEMGEKIYEEAKQVLETVHGWYQLKQVSEEIVELCNVHILAVPTACSYLTNTLISDMRAHNANINLYVHECQHKNMMSQLAESKVNIGILSLSSYDLMLFKERVIHQGWKMEILHEENRELFLSAGNPLVEKEYLTVEDLKELTYACYSRNSDAITEQYKKYFEEDYCYALNNYYNILEVVAEDKAVTILPPKILQENIFLKKNIVISKPIQGIATQVVYVLLYPSDDSALTKCENKIVKMIKETFSRISQQ